MSDIPELNLVTKSISGTPIRVISVIFAIAGIIVSSIMMDGPLGFFIGLLSGLLSCIFLFSFATVVDACHKYLKEDKNTNYYFNSKNNRK